MNRNNRVLLSSLGLLTAGGGFSPALSNIQSWSWPSFLGGGTHLSVSNLDDVILKSQNLEMNQKSLSDMDIKIKEAVTQESIKEIKNEFLDLKSIDKVDTKNSEENAKGIFKEIKKETQTLTIDKNSTGEVSSARGKVSSSLPSYKSALQKVKSYQFLTSRRQRRSPSRPSMPELTINERKALSDFYRQYQELKSKSKNFSTELKKVEPDSQSVSSDLENECKDCDKVYNALQQIGWESQPALNIFTKRDQKWNPRSPVPKANLWKSLWGDWDNKENPYSRFWESTSTGESKGSAKDKWTSTVDRIYRNRKKYFETVNSSSWRACGLTLRWFGADCGYSKKGSMEQEIKDSHSEVELTIAKTLLTWMSQV